MSQRKREEFPVVLNFKQYKLAEITWINHYRPIVQVMLMIDHFVFFFNPIRAQEIGCWILTIFLILCLLLGLGELGKYNRVT